MCRGTPGEWNTKKQIRVSEQLNGSCDWNVLWRGRHHRGVGVEFGLHLSKRLFIQVNFVDSTSLSFSSFFLLQHLEVGHATLTW